MSNAYFFRTLLLNILIGTGIFQVFPNVYLLVTLLVIFLLNLYFRFVLRRLVIFILIGILIGAFRILIFSNHDDQASLAYFASEKIQNISGEVDSVLKTSGDYTSFLLSDVKINEELKNGLLFVRLRNAAYLNSGDQVVLTGILSKVDESENFSTYLMTKSTNVTLKNPKLISYVELKHGSFSFVEIRKFLKSKVDFILPKDEAGFLNGLLLGESSGISEQIMSDFRNTGLSHVLVISGYNISLIATVVLSLLGFLPRKLRLILAGVFVILFTILVGAGAPVLRACLMGMISLFAMYSGRTSHAWTTLLVTANLMILKESSILLYDISFQLSFLATMGVMYVSPKILPYCSFLPDFFSIRESFALTISSQISTLPIILYNFGMLSLVSPLANILILPLVPISMFFGFMMILVSIVSMKLTVIFSALAYLSLSIILKITAYLSTFTFSSVEIPKISIVLFFLYYFFLIFRLNKNVLQNF